LSPGRAWLLLCAVCAVANAGAAPTSPAPPPATEKKPVAAASKDAPVPDEDFLEFLGQDDVGDTALLEYLKRTPPRGNIPPAAPPQDAKK
jgi:hypothetical protein